MGAVGLAGRVAGGQPVRLPPGRLSPLAAAPRADAAVAADAAAEPAAAGRCGRRGIAPAAAEPRYCLGRPAADGHHRRLRHPGLVSFGAGAGPRPPQPRPRRAGPAGVGRDASPAGLSAGYAVVAGPARGDDDRRAAVGAVAGVAGAGGRAHHAHLSRQSGRSAQYRLHRSRPRRAADHHPVHVDHHLPHLPAAGGGVPRDVARVGRGGPLLGRLSGRECARRLAVHPPRAV